MKRSLSLDLGPARQEASVAIDRWFGTQIAVRYPLAALHAAKARAAAKAPLTKEEDQTHPLAGEAIARRLSLADTRALVLRRAAEQDAELLALEASRQDAKRELAAATTGQQIAAIRNRFA